MGAEDFRVSLTCDRSVEECCAVVENQGFHPVASTRRFEIDAPSHVIELEVWASDHETHVSLRFALCQPDDVVSVFIPLARRLAKSLHARPRVLAEPAPVNANDHPIDDPRWSSAVVASADAARELWRRDFGPRTVKATCTQALTWFVIEPERRRAAT